jgi:hypothetical protein
VVGCVAAQSPVLSARIACCSIQAHHHSARSRTAVYCGLCRALGCLGTACRAAAQRLTGTRQRKERFQPTNLLLAAWVGGRRHQGCSGRRLTARYGPTDCRQPAYSARLSGEPWASLNRNDMPALPPTRTATGPRSGADHNQHEPLHTCSQQNSLANRTRLWRRAHTNPPA